MSAITIGYFRSKEDQLMSNIVIMDNFLKAFLSYAEVVTVNVSPSHYFRNFRSIHSPRFDYLIADIKGFGAQQFILRERHKLGLPFIVIIHSIFSWIKELVSIIPLIKKEDVIVAPSEFAKKVLLRIAPGLNVHFIPHCLDIEEIKRVNSYHDNGQRKNIAYMGRLTEKKGAGEIIECLPKIKRVLGNVKLNIIGPLSGSELTDNLISPFIKNLKARIKTLGLTKEVSFLGLKMGKEKYRFLSQNDLFIFPTIAKEETMGVVLLEAFASGLPVIASDWAACREIIRQGKNGYLVPVRQEKSGKFRVNRKILVSRIIKVLKDKKLRLRVSKGALATAEKYDYKKVIPMLLKLLRKRKGKIKFYDWRVLKNKQAVDFKRLFSRDFLFFIGYYRHSFCRTYGSLLKTKQFFGQGRLERREEFKKEGKGNILISPQNQNKIRRDFELFLLRS
jgi:glycosyltransferase involved in cell wall biosynthesis